MDNDKAKERHNITVDKDVWDGAGRVLASSGLSRSWFIESVFRAIWESDNKTYKEVTGELFTGLVNMAEVQLAKKGRKKKPK